MREPVMVTSWTSPLDCCALAPVDHTAARQAAENTTPANARERTVDCGLLRMKPCIIPPDSSIRTPTLRNNTLRKIGLFPHVDIVRPGSSSGVNAGSRVTIFQQTTI